MFLNRIHLLNWYLHKSRVPLLFDMLTLLRAEANANKLGETFFLGGGKNYFYFHVPFCQYNRRKKISPGKGNLSL